MTVIRKLPLAAAAILSLSFQAFAENLADPVGRDPAARIVHKIPGSAQSTDGKTDIVPLTDFTFKFVEPDKPSGETLVLLHGSGGDEASLIDIARKIAPHARLFGVRGRIMQEGVQRWYKRVTPITFDQDDIKDQADAFALFLKEAAEAYKFDPTKTTFLGYSNGANLVGAMTLLHPGLVTRAVLLRAMPVLDASPKADLSRTRFLTVAGKADETYAQYSPKLEKILRGNGASVDARRISSGHMLGDEDVRVVTEWLASKPKMASK